MFLVFLGSMGMPLFFMMAGVGSLFALRRRTGRQFAMERTKRLFIPFVIGCILLSPVQFYMEWVHKGWYQGSFLQFVPVLVQDRLHMLTTKFSPITFEALGSHLWFLGYLFTFSLIALPLFLWLKTESGRRAIAWLGKLGKRRGGLLVFVVPVAAVRMSLQPFFPGYTDWADYAYMLVFFVCGYILFADQRLVGAIQRDWKPVLSVGILSTLTMLVGLAAGGQRWVQDPSSPGCYLGWGLVAVNGWCLTLFALWLGMRFLDFRNRWLDRGQELIVPFYVFHQPPIVVLAFFAVQWPVGWLTQLAVVVLGSLAITIGLCELVARRIRPVRALFGLKPSWRLESTRTLAESRDRILPGHRIALDIGWPASFYCLEVLPKEGWRASGGRQDPQCSSPGDCLRPVVNTQFAVDIAGVGLDRVQRDEKPRRDLWIGQPFGDELEDFELAFAQRLDPLCFVGLGFRFVRLLRLGDSECG